MQVTFSLNSLISQCGRLEPPHEVGWIVLYGQTQLLSRLNQKRSFGIWTIVNIIWQITESGKMHSVGKKSVQRYCSILLVGGTITYCKNMGLVQSCVGAPTFLKVGYYQKHLFNCQCISLRTYCPNHSRSLWANIHFYPIVISQTIIRE